MKRDYHKQNCHKQDYHKQDYQGIADFYPFYLSQHRHLTNRRLHLVGTSLLLVTCVIAIVNFHPVLLLLMPVFGYGFAWFGHFVFEKNKPATFRYPFLSFICDFIMFKDILLGRLGDLHYEDKKLNEQP